MFYDEYIRLCNSISKSPTAVAKEMGFAGAHVTKWKNGSIPTDATIFKVCDYFNLPHDYFSAEKKTEKKPTQTGERKGKLRSVSRLESANITPEMDKNISDYIDFLLNKKNREE